MCRKCDVSPRCRHTRCECAKKRPPSVCSGCLHPCAGGIVKESQRRKPIGVFRPASNAVVGGKVHAKSIFIKSGVTVRVSDDLDLSCSGNIIIEGGLLALAARERRSESLDKNNGLSLTLSAEGDIEVRGKIMAGSGKAGPPAGAESREQEISVAANGGDGGSITLASRNGSVLIRRSARLVSGNGAGGGRAKGAGRSAQRYSENGGNAVAVGGDGGSGGNISLSAGQEVAVELAKGVFTLGNGGDGGSAIAVGGDGGNTEKKDDAPGNGGGVYCRGGNGGNSGMIPTATLQSLVILDEKSGNRISLARDNDDDSSLLKRLIAGGKSGNGGRAEGSGGNNGSVLASSRRMSA